MKIEYIPEPIPEDELASYIMDELHGFAEAFNLKIDENGFVSGTVTPSDVVSLGYKLLAWYITREKND